MLKINYILLTLLCLLGATDAMAQRQPETAQVNLYFPLVLDGGPKSDQFQTTFTFTNTSAVEAAVTIFTLAPNGSAWKLNLASSATGKFDFSIPAGASRTFSSSIGSDVAAGWAVAYSSAPVQAMLVVREIADGFTFQQFVSPPILPSLDYIWPGDKNSLVSIGNVYTGSPVKVDVGFLDSEGSIVGEKATVTIEPGAQTLMSIAETFPAVGDKKGKIVVSGVDRPHDVVTAICLAGTGQGVYSVLPNGGLTWPISHWDRIWMVYSQVYSAAKSLGMISDQPELKILGGKEVNAFAQGGKTVGVTLGLSQLISDSPSELAFALAHELGHIYQQRNGGRREFHPNSEFDADVWGALLSVSAGFDPYAAAGTLAKLSMATGRAGLASQFEDQLGSDAHKSFNERLDNVFENLVTACNSTDATKQICSLYKGIVHPNLPEIAPLARPGTVENR